MSQNRISWSKKTLLCHHQFRKPNMEIFRKWNYVMPVVSCVSIVCFGEAFCLFLLFYTIFVLFEFRKIVSMVYPLSRWWTWLCFVSPSLHIVIVMVFENLECIWKLLGFMLFPPLILKSEHEWINKYIKERERKHKESGALKKMRKRLIFFFKKEEINEGGTTKFESSTEKKEKEKFEWVGFVSRKRGLLKPAQAEEEEDVNASPRNSLFSW